MEWTMRSEVIKSVYANHYCAFSFLKDTEDKEQVEIVRRAGGEAAHQLSKDDLR